MTFTELSIKMLCNKIAPTNNGVVTDVKEKYYTVSTVSKWHASFF